MPSKDVEHGRITEGISLRKTAEIPPQEAVSPNHTEVLGAVEFGGSPREPYYPDGKIPRHRTAIRMMPPVGQMPPKPPGANRKK